MIPFARVLKYGNESAGPVTYSGVLNMLGNLTTPLRIGGYEVVFNAYFDQIRITNSALYSGASFTPPVPPLN